jgi:thymidylate kinase
MGIEGKRENKIYSIAFEGIHRVGKGSQIKLLKERLTQIGIPCISIKGEGYRSGSGLSSQDPKSDFWNNLSKQLKDQGDLQLWDEASRRLARELIVWRDRILAGKIDKSLAPFGVLLIDRSLISKAILKHLQSGESTNKIFSSEDLYPTLIQKHKQITVDMVLPDIIIELIAPKEVLLARLDVKDQDYDFRKHNIENNYELYLNAKQNLPLEVQERIVTIDSIEAPEQVYSKIIEAIKDRIPAFRDDLIKK